MTWTQYTELMMPVSKRYTLLPFADGRDVLYYLALCSTMALLAVLIVACIRRRDLYWLPRLLFVFGIAGLSFIAVRAMFAGMLETALAMDGQDHLNVGTSAIPIWSLFLPVLLSLLAAYVHLIISTPGRRQSKPLTQADP